MKRFTTETRSDWEKKVEEVGLLFHHTKEGLYWDESAYYELTSGEVDELERATNELQKLCLDAAQHVIDTNQFDRLAIPRACVPLIKAAWEEEPPAIYGRFDLSYDGRTPPKLLEYNADTPTALLEASVVQWFWLEEKFKGADQFNSIHERLQEKWTELRNYLKGSPLYFAHSGGSVEDMVTVSYLQDTAEQAGLRTSRIAVEEIGWSSEYQCFVDLSDNRITSIFKLYPWEWMMEEEFGEHVLELHTTMDWLEPIWKMLLSNKGILPILWEVNPGHPNLLEAYFQEPHRMKEYTKKPLFSREGANIQVVKPGLKQMETGGTYGKEGFICQKLAPLPDFDGYRPVVGSWVIDGESAGIGIRETRSLVTDNTSRFVPHLFR